MSRCYHADMRKASARKNPLLNRYWIEFTSPPRRHGIAWLPPAVGVTAYSVEDALDIVRQYLFEYIRTGVDDQSLPPVIGVSEEIDVSTITGKHIILGIPIWRGIWYPPILFWDWDIGES